MPSWSEYKAHAAERGALAFEAYVCQSEPTGSQDAVKAALEDHLAYIQSLEVSGKIIMAGPMSDLSGENMEGVGMIVFRAGSLDEAHALADGDPMHSTGARSFTLRRWLINEGRMTVSVGLSTKSISLG